MEIRTPARDCPPRYSTPRTESRPTLGTAAGRIAAVLGTPFMPWQQHVADVALEIDPVTRRFVYREVILTVPRQSGKTTSLLSLILARALSDGGQRILYTAQTRADARKKWSEDWLPVLEKSEFKKYFRTRLSNGDESLLFTNGSRQGLLASTERSGHGGTIDLGILDEAFAQRDNRAEQALKPAMVTRPQPQLWIVSTAGTEAMSPYLWQKVESGRILALEGLTHSVAYFEWSAEDDMDPGDPETWYRAMPALGRTIELETIEANFKSMDLNEFRRAFLNQWTTAVLDPVIPLKQWNSCIDERSEVSDPVVLSIDATPDRSRSCISVAGRQAGNNDKIHVEVVEHKAGTAWVIPRLKELISKWNVACVVWDPVSPIASLSKDGKLPGLFVEDHAISSRELAQACGMFFDAAAPSAEDGTDPEPTLVHLGDQRLLGALDGAVKQTLGDGAWKWSRKNSSIDISPLVSSTLAHWGAVTKSTPASVWDLNEIVERMKQRKAEENGEDPSPVLGPTIGLEPVDKTVSQQTFVPL